MPEAETKAATRVPSLDLTPAPHRRRMALLAVCLGFFVIQLDVTIVNVALPAIQREIGGSLAGLQWIIDGYTLPLAVSCSRPDRPRTGWAPAGSSWLAWPVLARYLTARCVATANLAARQSGQLGKDRPAGGC